MWVYLSFESLGRFNVLVMKLNYKIILLKMFKKDQSAIYKLKLLHWLYPWSWKMWAIRKKIWLLRSLEKKNIEPFCPRLFYCFILQTKLTRFFLKTKGSSLFTHLCHESPKQFLHLALNLTDIFLCLKLCVLLKNQ